MPEIKKVCGRYVDVCKIFSKQNLENDFKGFKLGIASAKERQQDNKNFWNGSYQKNRKVNEIGYQINMIINISVNNIIRHITTRGAKITPPQKMAVPIRFTKLLVGIESHNPDYALRSEDFPV